MKDGRLRDMESTIDFVLHRHRERMTTGAQALAGETPLQTLLRQEEGDTEEESKIRVEAIQRTLEYVWAAGEEELLEAWRRFLLLTKALRPDLIGDASLEKIAEWGGDGGRATTSARAKRMYSKMLEAAGFKGVKAPFQKSEAASRKFSEAQKGNRNRTKNMRRKRRDNRK